MQSFKKYIKRFLIALGIVLATIALFLFIIAFFYGDKTKQLIVSEISKKLNVEIKVKEIEFSIFKNFPDASVEFTDIQTREKAIKNSVPLLQAEKLSLLFDIIDILWGDYKIEKIILKNASLNLVIINDSINNFSIFQKREKNNNQSLHINLQKVILNNVNVSYLNHPSDQEYVFRVNSGNLKGAFSKENYNLDINGDIYSTHIRTGKTVFLKNQELKAALNIAVDQYKGLYTLNEAQMTIGDVILNIEGTIRSDVENKNLELTIQTEKSRLPEIIGLIPEEYKENIKDYTLDGEFILEAKIEGNFSGNVLPDVSCTFSIDNGKIKYSPSGLMLKNVSFGGTFNNGLSRSIESYSLHLSGFSASLTAGRIQGELTMTNFLKPLITAALTADIKLDKIDEIIQIEELSSISGNLSFNLQFSNSLKNLHKFTINDFISSRTSGTMKISGVNLKFKNNPVAYNNLSGSFKFNNKDLLVESFTGKINTSDFYMKGYFLNVLAYTFIPGENIKIKADFSSSNLNMDDLLSIRKDRSGAIYRMKFSSHVNFDLDLKIEAFTFGSFKGQNIRGNAIMKDKKLMVKKVTLDAMEGTTELSGSIDGNYSDKFWLSLSADLDDLNIQQLFYQLGDFGQQNITSDQLRGKVDATVYYKSFIDPGLNIDPKSVYALGDVVIRQGELIKYTPLYKLSKYIKQKELEHIRFSTLKNQIEIKEQVVYIPEMDIESSTLNLMLFGNHTFENKIDYHVRILLSELLSKREKKKEEDIEGIFPEEDGLGNTTLYLRMTGNAEDPDIRYDTKEVRKKISSDMNKEKQEIKDAFSREFSRKDKDRQTEQDELNLTRPDSGKDFKIEWDEVQQEDINKTELPVSPKNEPINKTKKKEFIIEWDEENDTLK